MVLFKVHENNLGQVVYKHNGATAAAASLIPLNASSGFDPSSPPYKVNTKVTNILRPQLYFSPVQPVEAAVRSHGRDGRVLPEVEDLGGRDGRLVDKDAERDVPDLRDLLG